MENRVIYFLTLAYCFSAFECLDSNLKYNFLAKNYGEFEVVEPPYSLKWEEHFPQFSAADRNLLCLRAAEEAALDVVSTPSAHAVMHFFEQGNALIHLIKCRTVPPAYLHFGLTSGTIIVAMETNSFTDTQFSLRTINSALIPCSKMLEDDPQYFEMDMDDFKKEVNEVCRENRFLKRSRIGKFRRNKDRLHLCDAARKFLGKTQSGGGLVPVFQSDVSAEAGIFYEDGNGNGKHYALHCPTLPVMYLHHENLRVSTAVKILLVASEAK